MRVATGIALALGVTAAIACSRPTSRTLIPVDPQRILAHLNALAAAERKGSGIGTAGEQEAMSYVKSAFDDAGLTTSIQPVHYTRISGRTTTMALAEGGQTRTLTPGADFVTWTRRPEASVTVQAPLVFAGYGIVAPDYMWDDYKSADVKGKVVVVLADAPRNGDRGELGLLGDIYYSRLLYKSEEAARHGAAALLVIHEDVPTEMPWSVIRADGNDDVLTINEPTSMVRHAPAVEGWLNSTVAATLLQPAGGLEQLKKLAGETNFTPMPLQANASLTVTGSLMHIDSSNVVGTIKGRRPQYVLVSARWNRLAAGLHEGHELDQRDDGSGAAVMLEVAAAMAKAGPPERTVAFMVTTTHEDGLTGLRYYVDHPLFPLADTTAHVHIDASEVFGEARYVRTIGPAYLALASILRDAASRQGRLIHVERDPISLGYFTPSQTAFTEQGVPEADITTMRETRMPGRAVVEEPTTLAFQPVSAARDADLFYNVITAVANATNWPALRKPGQTATGEIPRGNGR